MSAVHAGATLRQLRIGSGLSLRELARRVGVSSAYLSRVEHGHDRPPSPERLREIAQALEISPTVLLELTRELPGAAVEYLRGTPGAIGLLLELARRRPPPAMLTRLRALLEHESPAGADVAPSPVSLRSLIRPERVVLNLSCQHLEDALDVGVARLTDSTAPGVARELATRMRGNDRERSAAIGGGVAVFHAIHGGVPLRAALVTLAGPLPVLTPDRAELKALVLVAAPDTGSGLVEAIAQAARLASYGAVEEICGCGDVREVLRRLERLEAFVGG